MKILKQIIILLIFLFYILYRIKPIITQDLVYTYDQGRDFLKVVEIFLYKNPTFIGPTTGIMGIYHGAWWYYILGIPFLVFKGNPTSFYFFNFIIQTISFVIIFLLIKKYLGYFLSFLFLTLITFSDYFIFQSSSFVGNTVMILPTLAFFLINLFLLLEKKSKNYSVILFTIGILLGFLFEFEFGFGFFLIPSYILGIFIFKEIKKYHLVKKNLFLFLLGLLIPITPRLLFEIKNNFIQTKVLINYLIKPKYFNPKPLNDVFIDRINMFINYYLSLFGNKILAVAFLLFLAAILLLIINKKIAIIYKKSLVFFIYLLLLLFLLSNLYKDNFWSYYYEGIQYLFIFIILLLLKVESKIKVLKKFKNLIIVFFCLLIIWGKAYKTDLNFKVNKKTSGLSTRMSVTNFIISKEKYNKNYCVKIYTPPVIPYTYNYLFFYKQYKKKINQPKSEWVNNQCWFIIEDDDYKKRQEIWVENNIPLNKKVLIKKYFYRTKVILVKKQ